MSTAQGTLPRRKPSKRPRRPTRRLWIDPRKPIQGQGIGTAITSTDYDPAAPAFPEDDC
ncbi:MAG: hypothetical protein LBK99_08650 [Opitutaceae bacterium]|nr:hypothetical protein [Opitutaceae bacterium]